ncbi:MAG: GTPase domain-containing protein, partial [Clostridia bacterium]|nr:GTPase domain-containing protein [Clostridia bacterium]
IKQYNFNDNQYNFRIWDTPGKEGIESLCTAFIKYGNDVIILTVAYDDSDWKNSINNRLEYVNEIVYEENPVKVVITKSDIDEDERRFKKEDVEEYLSNISEETYQNLEINKTVIETSAKNDTGINHQDGEERNLETCLEDYLLNLFDKQKTECEEEYEEE